MDNKEKDLLDYFGDAVGAVIVAGIFGLMYISYWFGRRGC